MSDFKSVPFHRPLFNVLQSTIIQFISRYPQEKVVAIYTTCLNIKNCVFYLQSILYFVEVLGNVFLWGYVKDQVYVPPLSSSIPELKVGIRTAIETITADMLQTVWNELEYRVDVCRITKGAHIEHLEGM